MGDLISDKKCTLCGEPKPAAAFGIIPARNDKEARLNSWCKRCVADRTAAYNAKNPDERCSRDQAYYERTKEQRRAYRERYGHEYNRREAVKESRRKHHQNLKRRCFEAYRIGRQITCECCNENVLDF